MAEAEPNGIVPPEPKEEPQPIHARPAPRIVDEDAARLEFGAEFHMSAGAQPLFISEVAHLLKLQVQGKEQDDMTLNPVLQKSLDYANRFGQLDSTDQAIAVREQLAKVDPELHPFEIAQLASLMPKEAEEAKAIIPSLADRYDDDVLNDILKNMDAWL